MSILLDTGVLYGALNTRDAHHREAQTILRDCANKRHGRVVTTSFTVDEACSLIQRRRLPPTKLQDLAMLVGVASSGRRPLVEVLHLDDRDLQATYPTFLRHYGRGLSFTDCSHLAVMERHGIQQLATFDGGFEGLAEVVSN